MTKPNLRLRALTATPLLATMAAAFGKTEKPAASAHAAPGAAAQPATSADAAAPSPTPDILPP